MTQRLQTKSELAIDALLNMLDRTPRNEWRQAVLMHNEAIFQLGYAEGYRVGNSPRVESPAPAPVNDTGLETGLQEISGYSATDGGAAIPAFQTPGEDKALANEKRTQAEKDEDVGFEFIREIARAFGFIAREYDLTPGSVRVIPDFMLSPSSVGNSLKITIIFDNPTIKKGI